MPYVAQVAKGKLTQLRVFGNDYLMFDRTGVRDYIHAVELVEGHVAAMKQVDSSVHVYKGAGCGTSVLELGRAFEEANDIQVL